MVIHILINAYMRKLLFIIFSLYSLFYTFVSSIKYSLKGKQVCEL